jgi:hypothetical protein
MRRRLRIRLRFGFGLAAGLTVLMVLVPTAYGAKPKPKPAPAQQTAAADQYAAPTAVSYVTLTAAKVGKCKQTVTKQYVPKKKVCNSKKACAIVAKAELAAKKKCDRLAQASKAKTKP